uniref:Putative secreted peptide n=1 Tax=Anopheles braziliensis TaxID=58242 RepID=A0A2M3ZWN8_9DIPT
MAMMTTMSRPARMAVAMMTSCACILLLLSTVEPFDLMGRSSDADSISSFGFIGTTNVGSRWQSRPVESGTSGQAHTYRVSANRHR